MGGWRQERKVRSRGIVLRPAFYIVHPASHSDEVVWYEGTVDTVDGRSGFLDCGCGVCVADQPA